MAGNRLVLQHCTGFVVPKLQHHTAVITYVQFLDCNITAVDHKDIGYDAHRPNGERMIVFGGRTSPKQPSSAVYVLHLGEGWSSKCAGVWLFTNVCVRTCMCTDSWQWHAATCTGDIPPAMWKHTASMVRLLDVYRL